MVIYLPHRLPIWRLPRGVLGTIRQRAGGAFRIATPASESGFVRVLPSAEVLFAWGLAQRHVDKAVALRWLHTPLSGVDRVLNPALMRSGIRVTSSRGVNSVVVAEHAMALLLSLTRGIGGSLRAQVARRWAQEELCGRNPPLIELPGRVLGVYGMGEIGRELAIRARAFGMQVWGLSRRRRVRPPGVDRMFTPSGAGAFLRGVDVLVVALPLTIATRGLIGEPELRRMKPTAILINVGRGELVQESALIRALRQGWIAGAGLDVFAREPLPSASPLWNMPQVVLSPHIAGTFPDYMRRAAGLFLKNLTRYRASRALLNEVDKAAGY